MPFTHHHNAPLLFQQALQVHKLAAQGIQVNAGCLCSAVQCRHVLSYYYCYSSVSNQPPSNTQVVFEHDWHQSLFALLRLSRHTHTYTYTQECSLLMRVKLRVSIANAIRGSQSTSIITGQEASIWQCWSRSWMELKEVKASLHC